jgi:hypothetical protein
MATLETGIKGQTSVAPILGCAPLCFDISISSDALNIALNADDILISSFAEIRYAFDNSFICRHSSWFIFGLSFNFILEVI